MTIIAYRDGIMAADTMSTSQELISCQCTKIKKNDMGLWGAAGNRSQCTKFLAWADAPSRDEWELLGLEDFVGLHIDNDGSMLYLDEGSGGFFSEGYGDFYAIGGGCEIAHGVFHMGGSAVDAVKAAAKHMASIGGTCESLSLDGDGTIERFKLEK